MSIIQLGARRPQHARQLTALQSAEIAVEQALMDDKLTRKECLADRDELQAQANADRVRAAAAEARQFHGSRVTSATTMLASFGAVMVLAGGTLAFALMRSLGVPTPLALLLALVEVAVFGGVGTLALIKLKGSQTQDKVLAGGLLLGLVCVAAFLIPLLAHARGEEMYAEKIAKAESRVEILTQMGGSELTRSEQLQLRQAELAVPRYEEQQEQAEQVFAFLLGMTMVGELLLSGYTADMLSRSNARRLSRRADRLESQARDAGREADAQDVEIYNELAGIATEHVLSIDTIGQIAEARVSAHSAPRAAAGPTATNPGAPTTTPPTPTPPTPPPAPTAPHTPTQPDPLAGFPRPRGSVTIDDPAPAEQFPTPNDQWDGVWA